MPSANATRAQAKVLTSEWVDCLTRLREARSLILRDSESFHEAAVTLEHIGQVIDGKLKIGLGGYEAGLLRLCVSTGKNEYSETKRLFQVVRDARNMAVHEGAWARHLNSRLIDLFLILEEAIVAKLTYVEDLMVRNPVIAEPWHMVAHARKAMLANSFSCLPIYFEGKWQLLCDTVIMRFLRKEPAPAHFSERLEMRISSLVEKKHIELAPAICCSPKDTLDVIVKKMTYLPVLVTKEIESHARLLGIVTPFDLL